MLRRGLVSCYCAMFPDAPCPYNVIQAEADIRASCEPYFHFGTCEENEGACLPYLDPYTDPCPGETPFITEDCQGSSVCCDKVITANDCETYDGTCIGAQDTCSGTVIGGTTCVGQCCKTDTPDTTCQGQGAACLFEGNTCTGDVISSSDCSTTCCKYSTCAAVSGNCVAPGTGMCPAGNGFPASDCNGDTNTECCPYEASCSSTGGYCVTDSGDCTTTTRAAPDCTGGQTVRFKAHYPKYALCDLLRLTLLLPSVVRAPRAWR